MYGFGLLYLEGMDLGCKSSRLRIDVSERGDIPVEDQTDGVIPLEFGKKRQLIC